MKDNCTEVAVMKKYICSRSFTYIKCKVRNITWLLSARLRIAKYFSSYLQRKVD